MVETDGNYILRQEILDSIRRVKASKKGFTIQQISPPHDSNFYLPNRKEYFAKIKNNNTSMIDSGDQELKKKRN